MKKPVQNGTVQKSTLKRLSPVMPVLRIDRLAEAYWIAIDPRVILIGTIVWRELLQPTSVTCKEVGPAVKMAHHDFEQRPFALNSGGRVQLAGGKNGRKTVVMIDALIFL